MLNEDAGSSPADTILPAEARALGDLWFQIEIANKSADSVVAREVSDQMLESNPEFLEGTLVREYLGCQME